MIVLKADLFSCSESIVSRSEYVNFIKDLIIRGLIFSNLGKSDLVKLALIKKKKEKITKGNMRSL